MLPEWFHQLGLMGWPLAGCSVVALSLCLERAVFFAHLSEQQLGEFGLRLNKLAISFETGEFVDEHEPRELATEELAA